MKQKRFVLIFALLLTVLIPITSRTIYAASPKTEILWDTWGVPHIFAGDNVGLFYAFGWAQAQNHGDLLLKLYGESRGRAAEYWGADYLQTDELVRTLGIPQEAAANLANLPSDYQAYVRAFAAGINDYVKANPDQIDPARKAALPIQPIDILAHGIRTLRYTFVAGQGINAAKAWAQQASLPTQPQFGSNAWAIAPLDLASGKAMLVANPHQPWSDLGLWVEAHLISPDVNVYGAALIGNPVLGIGFNESLGWTHTVNTHDGWDLYQLKVAPDGITYLYDSQQRTFDTHQETIRILQKDGTFIEKPLTVRRSVHGAVIASRNTESALALRVVGEHLNEATIQWWEMARANNLQEFEAALKPVRIPMFTIMYADRDGNIMHLFNEQVPIRSEGDWAFWNNTTVVNNAHPAIIPGDSSRYLWTKYHPYEDLPRVLNPVSGWLQNANEPPWTTTLPLALDPKDYPAYMIPPPFIWPRPQTSMRLLAEHPKPTFEQLIALKQSTYAELATQVLDDLIKAAQASDKPLVKHAAEILAAWDRTTDVESVGAALFTAWALSYVQPTGFPIYAKQWDIHDPLNTPRGLSNPAAAVAALEKVATQLESVRMLGGGIDIPYGKAFRLRIGKYDLPASGSFDVVGTFRTLTFMQDKDLRFKAVHGDSYIAVIEFSQPVHATVLLSYGNATQPNSSHLGDQLELFSRKELREAWLTRPVIEAHLEDKITFDSVNIK